MGRAAGDKPYYEFVLRKANGRYDKNVVLKFPSTSTVVKRTLAAPQLVGWAYRQTLDSIAGITDASMMNGATADDLVDMLADAAWADEWLKENEARPDDVRDARAESGTAEHKTFETLAKVSMEHVDAEWEMVEKLKASSNPYERAIGGWWADTRPDVVASEAILPAPTLGVCGTVDLVWVCNGNLRITDLKTRVAERTAYDSDYFQVDGYVEQWNAVSPTPATESSILVVRDDGTYTEYPNPLPPGSFMKLKEIHDLVRRYLV